jgi:acyl dehydratase
MSLLTPELRRLVGSEVTYTAPEPVGRASIRYFALAIGDHNPLYTDVDAARARGYPDVIAPPTLLCETNQYAGLPRDAEGYAGHAWPLAIPGTRLVRGGNAYVFYRPVLATDIVTVTWRLDEITARLNAKREELVIIKSSAHFENQSAEKLIDNVETMILMSLEPE